MAGTENKVQFNLKNVAYGVMTALSPTPTWGAPVMVPGAVSLALSQQGEITKFYADGIVYWQSSSNNGYEGDLTMARFPDQMIQDIWGDELVETDNVLVENANTQPKAFALLFQIEGDQNNALYCMYNCVGTRPNIEAETTTETKEPKTQVSTISAAPLPDGKVRARTTATTPANVVSAWYEKVYVPGAAAAASASNTPAVAETGTEPATTATTETQAAETSAVSG